MMTSFCSRRYVNRVLSQCLSVGTFATLSLLLGIAPGFSGGYQTVEFNSVAYAQASNVTNEEVTKVARAILAMEPGRQSAYNDIKKLVGSPPNIICGRPNTLRSLPRNAQAIARNYCQQSQKIIQSNGLTNERFNQVTIAAQSDKDLQTRIQNEMLRLQSN